jgi:hypothetical protein
MEKDRMKRLAALSALALLILAAPATADESVDVYAQVYLQADSLQQKYAAALNLVLVKDRAVAPVLAGALEELVRTQMSYTSPSDKELFARTARIVSTALGEYKYDEAAAFLWDVVAQVPDPLAKAEALVALGKMRALDYAERISLLLRDLNLQPTDDRDYGEKVAYGAIISLEKLKDLRGFSPVFFAASGWYSLRIRQQAERSLPNIVDDPTDSIKDIVKLESIERKSLALKAEMASRASAARKAEVAVLALNLGHEKASSDRTEARFYADLRKLALRSMIAIKVEGEAPVQGCQDSYDKGYDDEERLLALAALGANGSDPAASALRDIILKLNADARSGLTDEVRIRMAKAAIENAAITKNPLVKTALVLVAANDRWSSGVIIAAQTAVKALP